MNFVSRACSEGGSLAGPEAMVVWGGVTWLALTQRPSPGLDLTPRGLGPTQPTSSPGCSSERLSEPPSELVAFVKLMHDEETLEDVEPLEESNAFWQYQVSKLLAQ